MYASPPVPITGRAMVLCLHDRVRSCCYELPGTTEAGVESNTAMHLGQLNELAPFRLAASQP
jgi:hypothetical protein